MARTQTLLQMRDRVRQRADIEGSTHITDPEVDGLLNTSLAFLYGKIVEASEDDYVSSATITTIAAQEAYAIPVETFLFLRHVEARIDGQDVPLGRWEFASRHLYTQPWGTSSPLAYRLVGNDTIRLLPRPRGGDVVTLWYIPASPILTGDASTFDGRNGWEEWAILDAAIKCRTKSEEDISGLIAERAEAWKTIAPVVQHKDRGRPPVVQCVTRGNDVFDGIPRTR